MNRSIFLTTLAVASAICALSTGTERALPPGRTVEPGPSRESTGAQTSNQEADAPVEPPAAAPCAAPPPGAPDATAARQQIRQAEERLAPEPSLAALLDAALRLADLERTETSGWRRAARLQALLPTVRLTVDYDAGRDESLDRRQYTADRWGADTDRGYGFQLSAQWQLSELIFNNEELRVADALVDRAEQRESLLNLLMGYYFERRRLLLRAILLPPPEMEEALALEVRIHELTAAIDALTGGLLSRRLSRRNRTP